MTGSKFNREAMKQMLLKHKAEGRLAPAFQAMSDEELIAWADSREAAYNMRISQQTSKTK